MKVNNIITLALQFFLVFMCCAQATDFRDTARDVSLQSHTYNSPNIPSFFKDVVDAHWMDFHRLDSTAYLELCAENDLNPADSDNRRTFYTLHSIHKLFTSKSATNGSRGDILSIPYFWHWVSPNPRYKIYDVSKRKLLKDLKPSAEYARYASVADIDRTPYLYLSDLFSPQPKYYAVGCDTFPTFGWCSEREMATVCLMETLGFEGKIVAEGNHCWSSYWVQMKCNAGVIKVFEVAMDNTFDAMDWELTGHTNKAKWKAYLGTLKGTIWYNSKAHATSEKSKLLHNKPSTQAMQSIEAALMDYFKK